MCDAEEAFKELQRETDFFIYFIFIQRLYRKHLKHRWTNEKQNQAEIYASG